MTTNKELQEILALTSIAPQKEDYIVTSSSSSTSRQQPFASLFAGVRVSRGTLATFGDDTAKQFALHVDKLLKENGGSNRDSASSSNSNGLLVRGGDLGSRAAFLKNGSVKTFEENVSSLLNASLRQREIRQREKDNMKQGNNNNNNKPTNDAAKKKNADDEDDDDDESSEESSTSSSDEGSD